MVPVLAPIPVTNPEPETLNPEPGTRNFELFIIFCILIFFKSSQNLLYENQDFRPHRKGNHRIFK